MSEQEEFEFRHRLEQEQASSATPENPRTILDSDSRLGAGEAAISLGTGALGSIAGGLAGLGASVIPGVSAKDTVHKVQSALTYQPRSEVGRNIVNAISFPFEMLGRGADVLGSAATEAAAKVPFISPERAAEAGTIVNTGIQALPMALGMGAKAIPPIKGVSPEVRAAANAGYKFTPQEMGAGPISQMVSSFAGEPQLARNISLKNQPITNSLIAQDLKLAPDAELSIESIKAVRKKAGDSFEKARKMGRVETDTKYFNDLSDLIKERTKAEIDFPTKGEKSPLFDLIDSLRVSSADADSIVSKINTLRNDAGDAFSRGNNELGNVNKRAAEVLQDQLIRHAEKTGQDPAIVKNMIEARQTIAKSYAAQKALDGKGNINPQKYASEKMKDRPLTGRAKEVANIAGEFPRSNQRTTNIGSTGPTVTDLFMEFLGPDVLKMKGLGTLARYGTRGALSSDIGQAAMMDTPAVLEAIRRGQGSPYSQLGEISAGQRE